MRKIIILLPLLLTAFIAWSQQVDNNFKPKLINYGIVNDIVPWDGGTGIVTGSFEYFNGQPVGKIVKLGGIGSIDPQFQPGTGADNGEIKSVVAQYHNGSKEMIAFGSFTTFNGKDNIGIVRLNNDGSIDNEFHSSITGNGVIIYSAAVQSDGKIVIVGSTRIDAFNKQYFIKRLNENGSADNTFKAPAPTAGQSFAKIATVENDQLIVGGSFIAYGGVSTANNLVKLNSDGSIDQTFNAKLIADQNHSVSLLKADSFGHIYIAANVALTRLQSNGDVDPTFTPSLPITAIRSFVLQDNDDIIAATDSEVRRYSYNGTLVSSVGVADFAGNVFPFGDNYFVSANHQNNPTISHVMLAADLTVHSAFKPVMIAEQPKDYSTTEELNFSRQGDSWLVRSSADFYTSTTVDNLAPCAGIFRLNADLSYDNSFHFSPPDGSQLYMILYVDSDRKFFVGMQSNGSKVYRFNPDGTMDSSFSPISALFYDMDKLADNTYVGVTGDFVKIEGSVIKFNGSGVVDNSFVVTADNPIETIDVASNGKMYVTVDPLLGTPAKVNGATVKKIFRMNPDGTIDNSFSINDDIVWVRAVATNGEKLVTAGLFVRSSNDFPMQQWGVTGNEEFAPLNFIPALVGFGFLPDGDFTYLIAIRGGDFYVIRTIAGARDLAFTPILYRSVLPDAENVANPDKLYKLADGSLLIKGDKLYHIVLPATPNGAPTQLTAQATGQPEVTLNWKDNSTNELLFRIERAEGTGDFVFLATTSSASYVDKDISDGKSYKYRVRAANAGGFSDYSNVAGSGVITGLEEEIDVAWKVYPNPVRDHLYVEYDQVIDRFTVLHTDGRILETADPAANHFTINTSNYPAGLYLLRLEHSTGRKVLKIFKQ